MKTKISAKRFDLTPEIRAKAEHELEGLKRFFDTIISAEFVFDVEKHRNLAELHVTVAKDVIAGTADTDDMHKSMLAAVDKVKTQLKKHKAKLKMKEPLKVNRTSEMLTRPQTDADEVDV
ncbi:MAG: ribosome-associated translation inhibitor RaiA [candidate division Zixibacteria bacterium]|nr:ribosome-associated translation inhibitor RaiA [candidate division Zixibacteria bacterium]